MTRVFSLSLIPQLMDFRQPAAGTNGVPMVDWVTFYACRNFASNLLAAKPIRTHVIHSAHPAGQPRNGKAYKGNPLRLCSPLQVKHTVKSGIGPCKLSPYVPTVAQKALTAHL
jgi:hypothetical protein